MQWLDKIPHKPTPLTQLPCRSGRRGRDEGTDQRRSVSEGDSVTDQAWEGRKGDGLTIMPRLLAQ